jgi:hypothetical protein
MQPSQGQKTIKYIAQYTVWLATMVAAECPKWHDAN